MFKEKFIPFQFRYAEGRDVLFMFLGALGAIGHGVAFPLIILFFGQLIDVFADFGQLSNLMASLNFSELSFTPAELNNDLTLLQ